MPSIDEIVLADDPEHWQALGFTVNEGVVELGSVWIRLAGWTDGGGILSWSVRELASTELDGLPTERSSAEPHVQSVTHPNGLTAVDHVVAMTPALDRSLTVLQQAGLDLRRIRDEPTPAGAPRQAFFRLGEVILELVQEPYEVLERRGDTNGPARFWGLALLSDDLEQTVAGLSDHASPIRPAVQEGRQIATLRRSAGLAVPVALMSRAA